VSLDADVAVRFIAKASFLWHQRFALAPGVMKPGANDIEWLVDRSGLPQDLTGKSVLDVGTTNGGAAFICEARGASRVVVSDIASPERFGFAALSDTGRLQREFVHGSIYELPELLGGETFDIVLFWGVLYHLRHPLLGLDSLRRLARDLVYVETAVSDATLPELDGVAVVRCTSTPWAAGTRRTFSCRTAEPSWLG